MITVNGDPMQHKAGMTVRDVLKERNYVFPLLVVRVDGKLIAREDYDGARVADGADVQVIHLMSGG